MSKHTPGPWTKTRLFIENKPEVFAVTDGKWKGRLIAIIGECDEQTESDASLIAAAPALLEAARDALKKIIFIEEYSEYSVDFSKEKKQLEDAIAKAE